MKGFFLTRTHTYFRILTLILFLLGLNMSSFAQSNVFVYNKAACEYVKIVIITCNSDTIWEGIAPDTSEHFSLLNNEIEFVGLLSVESESNNSNIFIDPDLLYKTEVGCGFPFFEEPGLPS